MDVLHILFYLALVVTLFALLEASGCNTPLGMQDANIIKDSQIYAPPEASASGTLPSNARLNGQSGWCVKRSTRSSPSHFKKSRYMQIDLGKAYNVTGIQLQRRANELQFEYGKIFQLQYKVKDTDIYQLYTKKDGSPDIGTKNLRTGTDTIVFDKAIVAQYIRWFPLIDENPKCVRMEIIGCSLDQPTQEPVTTKPAPPGCISPILGAAFNSDKYFKESSYEKGNDRSFPGKFVLFSLPFAWCVDTSKDIIPNGNGYHEWITIDLSTQYKISAIQTAGYRDHVNAKNDKYGVKSLALEYKGETTEWQRYKEDGKIRIFNGILTKKMTNLKDPFDARFIRVRPLVDSKTLTCLKLQFFGCKASTVITTPVVVAKTTPQLVQTTQRTKVIVSSYSTFQGSSWDGLRYTDSKYSGVTSKENILENGKGILTDGNMGKEGPLLKSADWVGWARDRTSDPFIMFTFNGETMLTDLTLVMFVDEKKKMTIFKSVTMSYDDKKAGIPLYACSSKGAATAGDGVKRISIDIGKAEVKKLRLNFQYSQDWLLISEVIFNSGLHGAVVFKVSESPCGVVSQRGSDGGSPAAIIAGGCVAFLVLIILIILIIMRRKSMFKRRRMQKGKDSKKQEMELLKSMTDNPIYDQSKTASGYTEVYVDNANDHKEPLMENDVVYAAPDSEFYVHDDGAPGYSAIQDLNAPSGYREIDAAYAEPGSPNSPEDIQFNPIYEETYENPYRAVTGSSMYADPEQQTGRKSFEIKKFPRDRLKFLEKIGSGQFGEVIICEVDHLREILGAEMGYNVGDRAMVAVKTLKAGVDQSVQKEFMKEVRVMARLEHENVVNLLGVCDDEPKCMVVEYMENGDLNQFLKDSKRYEGPDNPRVSQLPRDVLLVDTLMYMAMQIASGMKYLSSHGFIHRDLATRNCLVGPAFTVKISDFGMSRYLYSKQYYRIEGKAILPIRWMAPESLFYGKFTSYTDVWAFGITIWEVFSYARETPYATMTDQQVIDNACSFVQERRKLFQHLRQPKDCPGEVYNVMMQCWAKTPQDRPTFEEIYIFFNQQVESHEESI